MFWELGKKSETAKTIDIDSIKKKAINKKYHEKKRETKQPLLKHEKNEISIN
jgi:hypothetical protein